MIPIEESVLLELLQGKAKAEAECTRLTAETDVLRSVGKKEIEWLTHERNELRERVAELTTSSAELGEELQATHRLASDHRAEAQRLQEQVNLTAEKIGELAKVHRSTEGNLHTLQQRRDWADTVLTALLSATEPEDDIEAIRDPVTVGTLELVRAVLRGQQYNIDRDEEGEEKLYQLLLLAFGREEPGTLWDHARVTGGLGDVVAAVAEDEG